MTPSTEHVAAVGAWLRQEFAGADIATGDDFKADYQWFRIWTPGAKADPPELVVSFEAFEDNTAAAIVAALGRRGAAEHLRATPARPLMLDRFLRLRPVP